MENELKVLPEEKTAIEPEQLVGTKWITWKKLYGDKILVEFVDKTHCIFTSKPNKFPITYAVTNGDLFISNITGPFQLKGGVLFNNNLPVFEKVA
ncbi:MAG: hypothetical protein LBH16_06520 [Treponema sp.]|nr:hypothetical protein [Treponema sp.]